MELNFMRFNGKPFGCCLSEIKIRSDREVKTVRLCGGDNVLQNYGRELRVINGRGEIAAPAADEVLRMKKIFVCGDRGALIIPEYDPFYAVLRGLTFSAEHDGGIVDYEFEFYELPREKRGVPEYLKHTAVQGENLWTVAQLYGNTVEELVSLNPHIKRPDRVSAGEEVTVRWR